MNPALQSRHRPNSRALCCLFFFACLWASWRSGRCLRRRSYSWRLEGVRVSASGFSLPCSACMAGCGTVLSGEAGARGPWSGFSSDCLAAARRFLSCSLRETRCLSAHSSHLVCSSMAGSRQCLQSPKALVSSSLSLNFALCLFFTSGRWRLSRLYSRRACLAASSVARGLGVALGFFRGFGRGVFAARFFLVGLVRFLCSIWKECWAIYLFTWSTPRERGNGRAFPAFNKQGRPGGGALGVAGVCGGGG